MDYGQAQPGAFVQTSFLEMQLFPQGWLLEHILQHASLVGDDGWVEILEIGDAINLVIVDEGIEVNMSVGVEVKVEEGANVCVGADIVCVKVASADGVGVE